MKNGEQWLLQIITPHKNRIKSEIETLGAHPYSLNMWDKGVPYVIKLESVSCTLANIIKQEAIASGIDAIVHRKAISGAIKTTDVLILGSRHGVEILAKRLNQQVGCLPSLGVTLSEKLRNQDKKELHLKGRVLTFDNPQVMGIINCSPDSFSDTVCGYDGKINYEILAGRIEQVISDGATFIDIGGVSTRPQVQAGRATIPTVSEEMERILPAVTLAVEMVKGKGVYVSVDTFRHEVAKACIEIGVDMINDQSALGDEKMLQLCADNSVPMCLMYQEKQDIFNNKNSLDPVTRVKKFMDDTLRYTKEFGMDKRLILDPGFGFFSQNSFNLLILQCLGELSCINAPILIGLSNKSMVGFATGKDVTNRAAGTLAAEMYGILNGANIVRTHNVANCVDAVKMSNSILNVT